MIIEEIFFHFHQYNFWQFLKRKKGLFYSDSGNLKSFRKHFLMDIYQRKDLVEDLLHHKDLEKLINFHFEVLKK